MIEKTIDGKTITISKFGAIEGWKLLHKLLSTLGPAIAEFTEDNFSGAVVQFFEKVDDKEMLSILNQLTSVCLIDGKKVNFNIDCADYMFTMQLCYDVIEHNYQEFFFKAKTVLEGINPSPNREA